MVRSLAETLGQPGVADLLKGALDGEDAAAESLVEIAGKILTGENTSQGARGM